MGKFLRFAIIIEISRWTTGINMRRIEICNALTDTIDKIQCNRALNESKK